MSNNHALIAALMARGAAQAELFAAARLARRLAIGDAITLRGVIEVTNVCRVNCDYCPMRRDNTRSNKRFQLSEDEIVLAVDAIIDSGIRVVLMQGGETPTSLPTIERALEKIRLKHGTGFEIILNLGNFSHEQYARLRAAGATSYILKHETSDADLFSALRHETLEERLNCLRDLAMLGYRIGTGIITSLPGQSVESIAQDIRLAGELEVDMCSVSPFVPAPDTPMSTVARGDNDLALNAIACLRLMYPRISIPSVSALEVAGGPGGQRRGFDAGANVITINFSGQDQQKQYLIYGRDRFIVRADHVRTIVAESGLSIKTPEAAA